MNHEGYRPQAPNLWALFQRGESIKSARRARARDDRIEESQRRVAAALEFLEQPEPSGLLGNGRLSDTRDAAAAGLLDPQGLYLGVLDGQPLFYNGDGSLLTIGRARSGKGTCCLQPALAHVINKSVVVNDLKDGELCYSSIAHRRGLGQPVVCLNPWNLHGLGNTPVNPLSRLVTLANDPDDLYTAAREIARILIPPSPKAGSNAWVADGARRLIVTRLLYLALDMPDQCTLGSLWSFANQSSDTMGLALAAMQASSHDIVSGPAGQLLSVKDTAEKQWEAYLSDVVNAVEAYAPNTALAKATSADAFDFATLKTTPTTVYLMTPSRMVGVASQWLALMTNHIIETVAAATGPLRTLFLIDEFAQLPAMSVIPKALQFYAGRGIQLWGFVQGRASLQGKYSPEMVREIEDQCILQLWGVEDPSLLKDVETWSGKCTVAVRGVSRGGGEVEALSIGVSEHARPVLQAETIRLIGDGKQILKLPGFPLFVTERIPYYEIEPWRHQLRDVREIVTAPPP